MAETAVEPDRALGYNSADPGLSDKLFHAATKGES
jgi:hypothetical protein